jgi:hypothetical protein
MLLSIFAPNTASAGLFSTIKDKVKANPVKSALVGAAAIGGAVIAAPYVASALGFGAGTAVAGAAGAAGAVSVAGAGIAGIAGSIWGGLVAAGGFVTGALGALVAGVGSLFSGIAGFIGGIIGSPLFIPALVVVGIAVAGYFLWKKYKRQRQDIGNGSDLPGTSSVSVPVGEISVSGDTGAPIATEIPQGSSNPVVVGEVPVSNEVTTEIPVAPEVTPSISQSSDALKSAHSDYIKAYNKYISLVTNIGGSENPDEEMRSNMRRTDVQTALNDYRTSYNKYITLLRQSNQQ